MSDTFESWLGLRPKWLQTAAADILNNQAMPQPQEILLLAELCVREVNGATDGFKVVPAAAFGSPAAGTQVRINEINSIEGVNALHTDAALDFGDANLVVIYGANGSGKSGFSRLLKHASGTRVRSELLPNVFVDAPLEANATFVIERSGESKPQAWTLDAGALSALQNAHVFDSEVARHYVNEKTEARYEPRRLRFLSRLVRVCEQVNEELKKRKGLHPSSMPALPGELQSTELARYIASLPAKLTLDELTQKLARSEKHTERMEELKTALQHQAPALRIGQIDKLMISLNACQKRVTDLSTALSDKRIGELLDLKATALSSRVSAEQAAKLVFQQASLSAVGEGTWRAMWDAARTYSTESAYPGCTFPHVADGAKCPLCQQVLDGSAVERLKNFESFVLGEVESQAKAAESVYQHAFKNFGSLASEAEWIAIFSCIPNTEQLVKSAWAAAEARRRALAEAGNLADVPSFDLASLLEAVTSELVAREEERALLSESVKRDNRSNMEAELRGLRMVDWCEQNRSAIEAELTRLKKLAVLDDALKKTNTSAFSRKRGELAEEEMVGGYQERFAAELRALGGGRIPIEPNGHRLKKGQFKFELSLVDQKSKSDAAAVLSEGEGRVVALAAFLADVSATGARTPFIFDDPISSLDHIFEEHVAARLIELAKTRQVLVFTHRLSLLTLLREAGKKVNSFEKSIEGGSVLSLKEIYLRSLDDRVGLLAPAYMLEDKTVVKALNGLIGERLSKARNLEESGDVAEYTTAMKAICSEVRILIERAVEHHLLGGVVLRFRRSVTTMGKLHQLAKISLADSKLLDDLMTKYSAYEHSQPLELPSLTPGVAEVTADAERLKTWAVEFKNRKVPADQRSESAS